MNEFDRRRGIQPARCRPRRHHLLLNRGVLYILDGDLASARTDLIAAAARARTENLATEEAKAEHNLGYVDYLQGNLSTALSRMDAALEIQPDFMPGVSLLDRARVLSEAGLAQEADASLAEAAEIFAAQRFHQELAEAELARAENALLSGDVAIARRLAAKARDRFKRRSNDRWRRNAELVLLQADIAAGRPGNRLAAPALRLAEELRADGLRIQARTAVLLAAEALLAGGKAAAARETVDMAGPVRSSDPITARLHTRLVVAKLAVAAGDITAGKHAIRTGLDELAKYQARFGSIDMQTASAVHGRRLAEMDLRIAIDSGRPDEVIAAAERGRASSRRLQLVRPPDDAVAADLLTELRQRLDTLRTAESDPAAAQQVQTDRRRVAELQRRIRARGWTNDGPGPSDPGVATRPASVADIESALTSGALTMLMFVELDGRLHAVVQRGGRSRLHPVGASLSEVTQRVRRVRADMNAMASSQLPAAIRSVVSGSLLSSLEWLDRALIRPIGITGEELVIVPTGEIGAVPWGNLPSLQATPVLVTPSATSWLRASGVPAEPGPVYAVAGPGLGYAEKEAVAVAAVWGPQGHAYVGEEANQRSFVRSMIRGSVLHVAAHGRHQTDNPLFSSIRIADGSLFAYELDRISRVPPHVILAACELGLATIRPGDESLGLTSLLLHWGSRCVTSSVARIADDAAAVVMVDYHRRLASGVKSPAALADAIAEFDGEAPVPFVCFGSAFLADKHDAEHDGEPVRA